jgi:hypothetical protein
MGVRHSLFPALTLGASSLGLPASRRYSPRQAEFSLGLVAGPSSGPVLPNPLNFRVRLFSSLQPMVAPPARQPAQDTPVTCFSRLDHLAPGRPQLLAMRWPGATGLASYLSGRFISQFSGGLCTIADSLKGLHGPCLDLVSFPIRTLSLSRLSASLLRLILSPKPPESPVRADSQ